MCGKKHRATGKPRGRPPKIPFEIDDLFLQALERRMDANTKLVRPAWKELARELGVSRSTISRIAFRLRSSGVIESIAVPTKDNTSILPILDYFPKSLPMCRALSTTLLTRACRL